MSDYLFQRPAAFIRLEGEDAEDFLQSQCSADLSGLDAQGRDTLWLNHKGKLVGDSRVWRMEDEVFGILSWYTPAAELLKTIDAHIIADDVEFEDCTDAVTGVLSDVDWPEGLTALWQGTGIGRFAQAALLEQKDSEAARATLEAAGLQAVEPNELERARIAAGVLRIPADAGADFTPLDVGLEEQVSFTKGCFLGQEVVARMHRLDRHLWQALRLRSSSPVEATPALPLALTAAGQSVGQLTSATLFPDGHLQGIAVVKRKAEGPYLSEDGVEWGEELRG
ncbi:MAG: hypothetical protein JJU20_05090 [Opitutales bacterium]|nr:hypothetical protein [Opitutales bacterium]